ncbi:MAG: FAD binding domain-containing protein [Acidimicrobiales bacterium]
MTELALMEPTTIGEATDMLRRHGDDAKVIGGGTALVLLMQQGLVRPSVLVAVRQLEDVEGWDRITQVDGAVHIGAGTALADVAGSDIVRSATPTLSRAASLVGNVRVRNAASVGGALAEADYAADLPAVLVNLGAEMVLSDGRTSRRVAAGEFFVDYFTTALASDELVTGLVVPQPPDGHQASYVKFSSRSAEDRPCVVATAAVERDDGAIRSIDVVVGAIGPTPFRSLEPLATATGRRLDGPTIATVAAGYAESCDPLDDIRGSGWYRRQVVKVLVSRALSALVPGGCDD